MNMPEEIMTLEEVCDYIAQYASTIYVAETVAGINDAYALTELPADLAIKNVLRFIKEGRIPHRVLSDEEVALRAIQKESVQ